VQRPNPGPFYGAFLHHDDRNYWLAGHIHINGAIEAVDAVLATCLAVYPLLASNVALCSSQGTATSNFQPTGTDSSDVLKLDKRPPTE